ncbi:hypothetical protein FPOAC1_009649 [Fusarium poae]|uniref:hypothetical protein n=1 Tax=Fusarium poae TaxID=36050 RepID=UPI001CE839C2|nr:hypothetical protein FPOAC1_009649 [Fusarium poae]KAG8670242.1 hypothetical protein FPOAC1_009649 [Fusarium poae]
MTCEVQGLGLASVCTGLTRVKLPHGTQRGGPPRRKVIPLDFIAPGLDYQGIITTQGYKKFESPFGGISIRISNLNAISLLDIEREKEQYSRQTPSGYLDRTLIRDQDEQSANPGTSEARVLILGPLPNTDLQEL